MTTVFSRFSRSSSSACSWLAAWIIFTIIPPFRGSSARICRAYVLASLKVSNSFLEIKVFYNWRRLSDFVDKITPPACTCNSLLCGMGPSTVTTLSVKRALLRILSNTDVHWSSADSDSQATHSREARENGRHGMGKITGLIGAASTYRHRL